MVHGDVLPSRLLGSLSRLRDVAILTALGSRHRAAEIRGMRAALLFGLCVLCGLCVRDTLAEEMPGSTGEPLDCVYAATDTAELESHAGCAVRREAGAIEIRPETIESIDFASNALSPAPAPLFVVGEGWFYILPSGRSARVVTWDNLADDFVEGLARTPIDGRIGYLDETLEIVIPPRFDGAWPFENGRALVCVGCGVESAEGDERGDDEHSAVEGGRWGYIDREGREVVPITLGRAEAMAIE